MAKKEAKPSKRTPEMAFLLCERLAKGESLRAICRDDGMMPESSVRQWADEDAEFYAQYARARNFGLDSVADEIIHIADTPLVGVKTKINDKGETETTEGDMIEHRRLQVEARKWYLAKLAPKRYGEKLAIGGDADAPPIRTDSNVTITAEEAYKRMLSGG